MGRYVKGSRTAAVDVLTWFLLVAAILSVLIRLGTKCWIFRKLTRDDYLSILSLVFCAAQSIALSMATANGYGRHMENLTREQLDSMMKSQYAANILFMASMCFSKLALSNFVRGLTVAVIDRRLALALEIVIGSWAIVGVFAMAFPCDVPYTWDYLHQQCIDMTAWWNYLGVSNIVTDVAILAQAIIIIVRLRTNIHRKAILTSVFAFRVLVVAAIICQLVFINLSTPSRDPTFDTAPATIATEFVQALSIVTSCAPQLKPFLDSLQSTGMHLNGMTRSYKTSASGSYGREGRSGGNHSQKLETLPPRDGNHTIVSTAKRDWDADSQSSKARIIRETRTWVVTEGPRSPTENSP
ncbi:hypothetical protein PHISP_00133 [Aspergillus sp. HF37]|nr:hypothetical protein PHISP_00133 [Aspergillus sp. HF37]